MNRSLRPHASSGIAACTIISKNYLPYARVLADSFLQHHTDIPFFVLLVDRVDGCFKPAEERFHLVELQDLTIPNLPRFCFQYTLIELNTAAKPYFLNYLFAEYGFRQVIYFDPDILILRHLAPLYELLEKYSIVLTPHLDAPLPRDGSKPDEVTILRAGTFNLGFIALANRATTHRLLEWWQDRLYTGCQMDPDRGYHVDQKWMDLVPNFFPDVYVLNDPGYNVAYWNLPNRHVDLNRGPVLVNGQPGFFFHFSGINPDDPQTISKHSNRFNLRNIGVAASLYKRYIELLRARGYAETKNWAYAYGHFDNGLRIPDAARRLYLKWGAEARRFGNPFETAARNSFFNWLNEGIDQVPVPSRTISHLWHEIYNGRPDVREAFPDFKQTQRDAFLLWTVEYGLHEHDIPDRYAIPILKGMARAEHPAEANKTSNCNPFGVNLAGHLNSEKGVGEAVRSAVRSLKAENIPYVLNNMDDVGGQNPDRTFTDFSQSNPYKYNLSVLGAGTLAHFAQTRGQAYFRDHFNIGHLAWELADFPKEYLSGLQHLDEIWVASTFIQSALARVSPIPVLSVPYAVTCDPPEPIHHHLHFGLPKDTFVFLFIFDLHSVFERKNPLALIRAFKQAFSEEKDVLLILKCAHSESSPGALRWMQDESRGANIRIIDGVLSREQVRTLIYLSNCVVSLHRAEGFGLTLGEAMAMAKPVIATGYSGNMDFMTPSNSLPVRYSLIPIQQDYGPYKRGFVWADPDVDHASERMRWVYENPEAAQRLAQQGQRDVCTNLCSATVGGKIKERLLQIGCD